jgi:hypothetical protein
MSLASVKATSYQIMLTSEKQDEKSHLEDLGIDVRIILK